MGRKLKKVGTFVKEHWLDFVILGGCAIVGGVGRAFLLRFGIYLL